MADEEDMRRRHSGPPPDLRPIISRLDEVRRKCHSLRARDDETRDVSARLDAVIAALGSAAEADRPEPPRYRELARQLFPVQRLFESLGFPSVARELTYVEKSLEALDPASADEVSSGPVTAAPPPRRGAPATETEAPTPSAELDEPSAPAHRPLPRPIAAMLLVLLLVVLGSVITIQLQSDRGLPVPSTSVDEPTVPAAAPPVPASAAAARPPSTPVPSPTESEPHGAVVVAEEIAQARLALADGDLDRAIHHVSQAALVDLTSSLVLDTGQTIVRELLARSDAAADAGRWEQASALVERARELSIRFGFPLADVDATAHRHDSMDRFRPLAPGDGRAIREAIGRRAVVILLNGDRREGRIQTVATGRLRIERATQVGNGGKVYYTEDIPLDRVREIRVYDD